MVNPYIKLFLKPQHRAKFEKLGIVNFYNFDAGYFSSLLNSKDPEFWEKQGEKMALSLFKLASQRVPAYKDFLKKHKINPLKIKTIKDFKQIPATNKKDYLKKYPLEKLCWDEKLDKNSVISVSSGSSGMPSFWPRGDDLEIETSIVFEMFSKDIFEVNKYSTLFINGFSMGIYIAGVVILNSALRTSQKGYPLSIMTPGINKDDILRIIKEIGDKFQQIIIAGYPPFIKDIIDQGEQDGFDWKKLKIKFLFAAEGFTEKWRDYIFRKVGAKDILKSSVNIYGSADASILGHETPISTAIRRMASNNQTLKNKLFGRADILPTFVQYNPLLKYFENFGKETLFSSFAGIPLIRYNIYDFGGVKNYKEIIEALNKEQKNNLNKKVGKHWKLPFVYVFGKSDFTVSLYGLNIYPQHIKAALEHKLLENLITGKFTVQTKNKENQDQYLEINIELKERIKPSIIIGEKIKKIIIDGLVKNNLEYKCLRQSIGKKSDPEIILWQRGDSNYFTEGIKQKWLER